ncbi:ClbS/DfsB family four-helix bundle protein [Clostridium estertheticum]|uniref:ClbS/DfsB family four-helix bundle protein n=1 Tax=Clostridium estertheticum TaxID=238834 RepID=UPI001C7DB4B9|nr:ClbS/DfsB family four-helix bundle protein [Clostridium estertheticum]MBX4267275.1 ClbS/DfsB family four-helix bundle protein [Clostridium estertheticum]WLC90501.1 ClbS/DfsB family four-helix bundle protein [Clostridium estertheticum]
MEYKIKLLEIIHNVNMEEENLITNLEYKKENFLGSYDNWTANDVVSHISEWRILSSKKLQAVKKSKYVSFHEEIDILNRQNYEIHKNETIEEVKLLSTKSYKLLENQIESFDNLELIGESKIDGFISPLWKYILIDGFSHTIIHIVFYYIKIQEFEKAFEILERNYTLLLELDNSKEMINNIFYLEDLLEELDEMINKDIILFNLRNFCRKNMENEIVSNAVLNNFMIVNDILY